LGKGQKMEKRLQNLEEKVRKLEDYTGIPEEGEFDTIHQKFIICPYCGDVEYHSFDYDLSREEYDCIMCNNKSRLEVIYSTFKK
jgi:hypothetical protein